MRHPFVKYQGLGNDFLVFDLRHTPQHESALAPKAAALCDRRFGVGGDGILLLLPDEQAAARLVIYNADGSRPEMCGNGIRCVARYLYERGGVPTRHLPISTDAGLRVCEVVLDTEQAPSTVIVQMGAPRLRPAEIPFLEEGERAINVSVEGFTLSAVSMGNPHAVIFGGFEGSPLDAARRYGPGLEGHPRFPRRANIEFARLLDDGSIDLAVFERGVGLTLACGTGACATAVAAVLTGRAPAGEEVKLTLPGGPLWIRVAPDLSEVFMRGAAQEAFAGEVDLAKVHEGPTL